MAKIENTFWKFDSQIKKGRRLVCDALCRKTKRSAWMIIGVATLICILGMLYATALPVWIKETVGSNDSAWGNNYKESVSGSCTTFVASFDKHVLFGNNEDFSNPNTFVWVVPASEETYGGLYLGYQHGRPQGGINEKGLAFDALALPEVSLNPHNEMPFREVSDTRFMAKFMSQCATVEEVIALAKEYNWGSKISFQVLFADASGDAVMISGGHDGELAFTRKPAIDGFLIGTNFNLAYPENRFGNLPSWRYEKAEAMLTQMMGEAIGGVDYFQKILEAVHVESADQNTLYSNIFDLQNGKAYLYYWHQYNELVVLDVQEQIQRNLDLIRLSDLFSEETVRQAENEFQQHKEKAARGEWLNRNGKVFIVGAIFVGIFLPAMTIFFLLRRRKKNLNNLS